MLNCFAMIRGAIELPRLRVKLLAERAQLAGDGEIETFLREIPRAPGHRAQIGTVDFAVFSRAVDFVTVVGRTSLLPNEFRESREPRAVPGSVLTPCQRRPGDRSVRGLVKMG